MKRRTKLFSGILMASMMLATTSFAKTGKFTFNLSPGVRESSSNVLKSDGEQKAYVTITRTNLMPHDGGWRGSNGIHGKVWFRVRHENGKFASYNKPVDDCYCEKFTLKYLHRVSAHKMYHLNGQQDSNDTERAGIWGRWTP